MNALSVKPDIKADLDMTVSSAVTMRIMDIFRPLIVYESANQDQGMIMEFPGYVHISEDMVAKAMLDRGYTTDGDSMYLGRKGSPTIKRPNVPELANVTDEQIVGEALSDSIITYRRKEYDIPNKGRLEGSIFDMICEFTHSQASRFYRVREEDCARGMIPISSRHALRMSQPAGSRFRMWTSVENYVKLYVAIFQEESIRDKVAAMIEYDAKFDMQHDRFLLRWREAGVI